MTLENKTGKLSWNIGSKLPIYAA